MPAMTMPFEVSGVTPGLRQGDRIEATLVVAKSRSWIEDVKITAAGSGGEGGGPVARQAVPGVVVPPFELRDQDDRPVTMREFAGRVLVVTFIYTRCPLPDFCPLMVRHLETVRRRAHEEGIGSRLALLGVTLDPAFDTPAVLRAYGESVLKNADRFEQWTLATGTPAQIEEVAQFFGVTARAEAGLVTHTLSTAVVGHDGRIMRLFASNSWRPDELYDVVRQGVERSARANERISTVEASMEEWNRRRFISTAAIAAGSGLAGWNVFGSRGLLAQAPPPGIPDEILNPVEVSGAEAVPVIGKLPGQKRMYVLPDNAGRVPPRRQPGDEADRAAGGYRRRPRARHLHREHRRHHAPARVPEQPCGGARDAR